MQGWEQLEMNARRGWIKLSFAVGFIAVVWLVVLPAISSRPDVAARIQHLEARGIDPSAIFYSELEAMPEIEARIRRVREEQPDLLW